MRKLDRPDRAPSVGQACQAAEHRDRTKPKLRSAAAPEGTKQRVTMQTRADLELTMDDTEHTDELNPQITRAPFSQLQHPLAHARSYGSG